MLSCVQFSSFVVCIEIWIGYVLGVDSSSCIKKGKDGEPPID